MILLNRLYSRYPNLKDILYNSGWLFFDKIFRMGMGMFLGVWIARYLGPDSYGKLNYVIAYIALIGSFTNLGLDGVVVRELIKEKAHKEEILSTSFLLQLIAGMIAFAVAILLIPLLRPDELDLFWMVFLVGLTLIFRAVGVVRYWYEAQVLSKYFVWLDNGLFFVFSGVRILLILNGLGIFPFIWTALIESSISLFGYYLLYKYHNGSLSVLHANWRRARTLLRDSWMLLLSGLAVIVYMRIDQIMIGQMMGDEAVGIYTAAVKISEVWYFIPMAVASSIFPAILKAKEFSQELYLERLGLLHSFMFLLALMIAIPMTFLSDPIIRLFFGEKFSEAGAVLAIHIWAGIFVFLGVASSRYYLTENLPKGELYKSISGCLTNIILNYFLIPLYGIKGAAIATVISQFVASTLFNLLFKRTREIFFIQLESVFFWKMLSRLNHLRSRLLKDG
ncbi:MULTISPECIES: flippase [Leptospira]|uniref:Polysaccharide biosynthesis protein n=3 Tax=Leptospira borgpetersenii TaxID=174 RepID=A0A0E3BPV0_LEPBO|nr:MULTISPECIES: flippase [Leptospira]EMO08198.1 polysaccharide biosynthesis protein [Leptospira borgpetersenii str. Noumea 25]MBF3372318.1 flippase [Leptospira borgpetersenii serovar Arborea]ALO25991.1 polysaccharide biosynthesis protein [Leptospira borgpetersenii serovar Ballum]ANH00758.1 Polysaccharide biosynthesis protein [Leptospira borgpetersenii str. 4E]EKR00691.1 polysaccharide biosynthesis protein [Leptospira borgpetersenii serovar Castellonis str. 200801910]